MNERVEERHARGAPVISVDAKKKELVGAFKNAGRERQPAGEPVPVRVHDFIDMELGKANPYGVDEGHASTSAASRSSGHFDGLVLHASLRDRRDISAESTRRREAPTASRLVSRR